jgi:hypothetical protein
LIMAAAGMRYLSERSFSRTGSVYFSARRDVAVPLEGYRWSIPVSAHDSRLILAGADSVRTVFDTLGFARVIVGHDSLAFDLRLLAHGIAADSTVVPHEVAPHRMRVRATAGSLRAMLALETMTGHWVGDRVRIQSWQGTLFLGR